MENKAYSTVEKSEDEMYERVLRHVLTLDEVSVSEIQRNFGLGYNRAAGILNRLIEEGYVESAIPVGSKKRKVIGKNSEIKNEAFSIIDGKALSAFIKDKVSEECEKMAADGSRRPKLCVIIAGDNSASKVYVRNKKQACEYCGIDSVSFELPESVTKEELFEIIDKMNRDDTVDGILVQLPLPKGIDEKEIIMRISPDKDVDCFHPVNVGRVYTGDPVFLPCTPAGIIELLKYAGVVIRGSRAVVVGRSNIVGKPVAALLMAEDATVTIAHSKTRDLKALTKEADILVAAIGKPKFFTADYIKRGAAVIDVGMDRDENGKLCGDVDFDSVSKVCGPLTPVPGGVGPMTVAMLMKNTLEAKKRRDRA